MVSAHHEAQRCGGRGAREMGVCGVPISANSVGDRIGARMVGVVGVGRSAIKGRSDLAVCERRTAAFDPSATWAGSADQLAVPADDSTVAFMRLKRAVDAVDQTLPDSGQVEQMLPNVAERKGRLKEQV